MTRTIARHSVVPSLISPATHALNRLIIVLVLQVAGRVLTTPNVSLVATKSLPFLIRPQNNLLPTVLVLTSPTSPISSCTPTIAYTAILVSVGTSPSIVDIVSRPIAWVSQPILFYPASSKSHFLQTSDNPSSPSPRSVAHHNATGTTARIKCITPASCKRYPAVYILILSLLGTRNTTPPTKLPSTAPVTDAPLPFSRDLSVDP